MAPKHDDDTSLVSSGYYIQQSTLIGSGVLGGGNHLMMALVRRLMNKNKQLTLIGRGVFGCKNHSNLDIQ